MLLFLMLLSFRIIKSQTLTLRQLQTKLQASVRSHSFFPPVPLPCSPICCRSLLHLHFIAPYSRWHFLSLMSFLTLWRVVLPYLVRMCLSLDLPNVFSWLDWGYPFWAGIPKIDVPFTVHQNRWHSVDMSLLSLLVLNLISWLRWYLQAKHSLLGDVTWNAS